MTADPDNPSVDQVIETLEQVRGALMCPMSYGLILVAEVKRLRQEATSTAASHRAEIREIEIEARERERELHAEHAAEMREAGAELAAMEREVGRAEEAAQDLRGW